MNLHDAIRSLRPLLVVLSTAFALGNAACVTTIVNGGGGGNGGSGAGGPTPVDPPPSAPAAIAILASQMGDGGGGGASGSSSSSGGGGVDPSTLYLELGVPAPTCANPNPALPCGGSYTVAIGLPPALQQPGTLSLDNPSIISFMGESGPLNDPAQGPDDCPGGGGSFFGTLEIESIDATEVVFRLSGTDPIDLVGVSVDGEYTAPRCP
jgi:hypothetical protein